MFTHSRFYRGRLIRILIAALMLLLGGIFLIEVEQVHGQNTQMNDQSSGQVDPMKLGKLTNYVVDFAKVLSVEQLAMLNEIASTYEQKTTNQVAAVLIPHRLGNELADIGLTIFRDTGLGQKDKNNGILLVISTEEKKLRIIVGYGLEGDVPDVLAREIIETSVRPLVDSGAFAEAIQAYYQRVMAAIGTSEGAEAIARDQGNSKEDGVIVVAAFFGFLLGLIGWRVFGVGFGIMLGMMTMLSIGGLRFGYLLGGIFAFSMKQGKKGGMMFFPGFGRGGFGGGFGGGGFGGGGFGGGGGSSGGGGAGD